MHGIWLCSKTLPMCQVPRATEIAIVCGIKCCHSRYNPFLNIMVYGMSFEVYKPQWIEDKMTKYCEFYQYWV